MGWRVGVDTGGTFTDVCLYNDESRRLHVTKVSSTPSDPGSAIIDGVTAALSEVESRTNIPFEKIGYFAHGTTVATNALLEGRGAKTGLLTTKGFRDLLELARQRRPKLYDLSAQKPEPLVSRDLRREIDERMLYTGDVERPVDLEAVRTEARFLREQGVDAVSICFLYSYLNSAHEKAVVDVVREELPDAFISASYEVLPEFREYERLSTVVINSFIGPVMQGYLSRLRANLAESGLRAEPKVVQSNGGVMSFRVAEMMPVRTILSGPSAGVVGAARVAEQSGFADIITFDMGGTSSDVALVRGARPTSSTGMVLDGRPVRAPMLDINTVGAGGGSIAWVDEGGHLKVGPRSAGADPGPACYGRGNTEPTVTDANVVLGVVNQTHLLGGVMPIDAELSFAAVERLGRELGLGVLETAQGIISVVTANMARAIRVISVQRGYDPVDYVLVAFGGAGPLHSGRLAAELGMKNTLLPQRPGALSALGMLMTDLRADMTKTLLTPFAPERVELIISAFQELETAANNWFDDEGIEEPQRRRLRVIDLRYRGQNYELTVIGEDGDIDQAWMQDVARKFHEAHRARYGYSTPDASVIAVTFRLEATADVPRAEFSVQNRAADAPNDDAVLQHREIYFSELGRRVSTPILDRDLLCFGNVISGPAVIEQYDTTCLVLPGEEARVDRFGAIVIGPRTRAAD